MRKSDEHLTRLDALQSFTHVAATVPDELDVSFNGLPVELFPLSDLTSADSEGQHHVFAMLQR